MNGETHNLAGALSVIGRGGRVPVTVVRESDSRRFYIPHWFRVREVLLVVFSDGSTRVRVFQGELPA